MKRKILLDDEIRLLNDRRETLGEKPYKKYGDPLSKDDIEFINEKRKLVSEDKFKIGRKVVQTKSWYGTPKGRVGWVTDVWPKTKVLFEDGREPNLSAEFSEILEPTEEYYEDIESLRERIGRAKHSKISRKSTY